MYLVVGDPSRALRIMLRESGRSATWLARRLRMSRASVSRWQGGSRPIAFVTLRKIGKVLGFQVGITVAPTASGRQGHGKVG